MDSTWARLTWSGWKTSDWMLHAVEGTGGSTARKYLERGKQKTALKKRIRHCGFQNSGSKCMMRHDETLCLEGWGHRRPYHDKPLRFNSNNLNDANKHWQTAGCSWAPRATGSFMHVNMTCFLSPLKTRLLQVSLRIVLHFEPTAHLIETVWLGQ